MRERIGNIGGKVKVTSARGKGTRIEVNAPVSSNGVDRRKALGAAVELARWRRERELPGANARDRRTQV